MPMPLDRVLVSRRLQLLSSHLSYLLNTHTHTYTMYIEILNLFENRYSKIDFHSLARVSAKKSHAKT